MSYTPESGPYVSDHARERFEERFPDLCEHESHGGILRRILALLATAVPWGAAVQTEETTEEHRIADLGDGRKVVFALSQRRGFPTPRVRTILTHDQALANQARAFHGPMSHRAVTRSVRRRRRR